jgi:hypothetical protein
MKNTDLQAGFEWIIPSHKGMSGAGKKGRIYIILQSRPDKVLSMTS